MSGQLVGEIGMARESGALAKLTPIQMLALVAIAEKCGTASRRGSVRLAYLMGWTGGSRSTVQRALRTLHDRGLITTARRGFKPNGGEPQAPVYELAELASPSTTQARPDSACVTQDDATSLSLRQNDAELASNRGRACVTQGDPHDVSTYDVSTYDDSTHLRNADDASAHRNHSLPLQEPPDDNEPPERITHPGLDMDEGWRPPERVIAQMRAETGRSWEWLAHHVEVIRDRRLADGKAQDSRTDSWDDEYRKCVLWAHAKNTPSESPPPHPNAFGVQDDEIPSVLADLFGQRNAEVVDAEVLSKNDGWRLP